MKNGSGGGDNSSATTTSKFPYKVKNGDSGGDSNSTTTASKSQSKVKKGGSGGKGKAKGVRLSGNSSIHDFFGMLQLFAYFISMLKTKFVLKLEKNLCLRVCDRLENLSLNAFFFFFKFFFLNFFILPLQFYTRIWEKALQKVGICINVYHVSVRPSP